MNGEMNGMSLMGSMHGAGAAGSAGPLQPPLAVNPKMLLQRLQQCVGPNTWQQYCTLLNSFVNGKVRLSARTTGLAMQTHSMESS